MKSLLLLIILIHISCGNRNNHYSYKAQKKNIKKERYCSAPIRMVQNSYRSINLSTFNKWQTFNEFKMRGMGKTLLSPFVYVKRTKDSIVVINSEQKEDIRTYYKVDNKWYNYLVLEPWKKQVISTKSSTEEPARDYYRICGNDTILELKCNYIRDIVLYEFYIKTRQTCVMIVPIYGIDFCDHNKDIYNQMLHFLYFYRNNRSLFLSQHGKSIYDRRKIYTYKLYSYKNKLLYKCLEKENTLYFSHTSLGLFGIQPGLEKYDRSRSVLEGY